MNRYTLQLLRCFFRKNHEEIKKLQLMNFKVFGENPKHV